MRKKSNLSNRKSQNLNQLFYKTHFHIKALPFLRRFLNRKVQKKSVSLKISKNIFDQKRGVAEKEALGKQGKKERSHFFLYTSKTIEDKKVVFFDTPLHKT